jgi:hypothetical protein
MSEPSPTLFPAWPPHVPRDLATVDWDLQQVKAVVQTHHNQLKAPPSPTKDLLGQLPKPLLLTAVMYALYLKPELALKLIGL